MWKKISAIVIPTLIAVGIIAYMLYRVWGDLLLALEHIVWAYLAVAVAICLFAWIVRGYRYQVILKGMEIRVGLFFSTATIFVSQTANLIIPARLGDLVRVFILKHEKGTTISQGLSSLVVERIFDIITVALIGALALPFVLNVPEWFTTVIIIPLALGAVFFGVLLVSGRLASKNRYLQIVLTMAEQMRQASLTIRSMVLLSASSILTWILDILVCLSVVLMFGQQIPFAVIALAIVIGNLVKAIPLTPGGVGTYELALTLTFSLAGVAPAEATLIAVIDHLIKNLVTLAGGIASIYYFGGWVLDTIRSAFNRELEGGKKSGL
jgi:uncharacterized protein (TIRG00374 family)